MPAMVTTAVVTFEAKHRTDSKFHVTVILFDHCSDTLTNAPWCPLVAGHLSSSERRGRSRPGVRNHGPRPPNSSSPPHYARASPNFSWIPPELQSSIYAKFVIERQDTNKMQAFRLAA
jgi:hypothetical protein